MRRLLIFLLAICLAASLPGGFLYAYDFESVPSNVKVRGRGALALDENRFKDGKSSLRFSWTGQAELMIMDQEAISASMSAWRGGVMFWICNETPSPEPIRVVFRGSDGRDICWFDFFMDFQGWRAAWVRYEDMHTATGYVYEKTASERRKDGVMMAIRPSARVVEGSFCIDRLTFSKAAVHIQNTPDKQIPDNNHLMATRREIWQWGKLLEWEGYPRLNPVPVLDKAGVERMEENLNTFFREEMPSHGNYNPVPYRPTLEKSYAALNLVRLEDGTPKGKPIVYNDESTASDVKIKMALDIFYRLALDYYVTGDKKALERFFLLGDHLHFQGLDWGSGLGTNHHYGYEIREWADALWLLREEIRSTGRMERWRASLEWWSGIAECRLPIEKDRNELLDAWNTLTIPKVVACMLQETPEMRQAYMEAFTRWMEGSLTFSNGTFGGFKLDGTSFHHGGNYPTYTHGAFSQLGSYFRIVRGTPFVPSEDARRVFKTGLLGMRNWCNLYDWATAIGGRYPFGGRIPAKTRDAMGYLAVVGDLTGSGLGADPELGGAFLALKGDKSDVVAILRENHIKESPSPEGFFVYNYGAFGVHRRKNWAVTLKAFNSDVWGSEIYAKYNRFGRYQSYGSVQVINSGNPPSAENSRHVEEGWDWNRLPGTTTIHLPWALLNSPNEGTLMERNDARFPGVSSLEGKNGVLAFTYVEKDRPNFCAGATATKSVFCFDNRLVFVGTGITNSSIYPTETTLFQQKLLSSEEPVLVDDSVLKGFPQVWKMKEIGKAVVEDLKGNIFILYDAAGLTIYRQHQSSPDNTNVKTLEGDFVSAVIDHGCSPVEARYEYLLLVEPTSAQRRAATKKRPYTVVCATNAAHVVTDHATGITGYISYKGYQTRAIEIPSETIVMERKEGDSRIMSVCTPDLGLNDKSYSTSQESQPLYREVVLEGEWVLFGAYADPVFETDVTVRAEEGRTRISVTCRHGHPVEFTLKKR